jgi:TetR/AcrR family transcriptional repressor of lmrAB and yxaGH operons
VLEHSGAPRGFVYHHFPGGKDQLVVVALDRAGDRAIELLDPKAGEPAKAGAAA